MCLPAAVSICDVISSVEGQKVVLPRISPPRRDFIGRTSGLFLSRSYHIYMIIPRTRILLRQTRTNPPYKRCVARGNMTMTFLQQQSRVVKTGSKIWVTFISSERYQQTKKKGRALRTCDKQHTAMDKIEIRNPRVKSGLVTRVAIRAAHLSRPTESVRSHV